MLTIPTALYRLRSASGDLLYVGITDNLRLRMSQHAGRQPWWPDVAKVDVEMHDDRASAEAAERPAIANEHPRWNLVGAPKVATPKRALTGVEWVASAFGVPYDGSMLSQNRLRVALRV